MKYFAFIIFLFSAIVLNSQVTIEEVAYIPSASGYYNNLIIKGDVNINKLKTDTFNIQSYGSILDINVSDGSRLFINTLRIPHRNGSAALLSNQDESNYNNSNFSVVVPNNPPNRSTPPSPPSSEPDFTNFHTVNMSGGALSLSKTRDADSSSQIQVRNLNFMSNSKSPTLNIKVRDVYSIFADNSLQVNELYIFGMKVPQCPGNYYWTNVTVGRTQYTVLACDTSTSS